MLLLFSRIIFSTLMIFPVFSFAETTQPDAFGTYDEYEVGTAGRNVCRLRINSHSYRVRRGGGTGHRQCGSLSAKSNKDSISPLGIVSRSSGLKSWIKIAYRGCNGKSGYGFVHENAFNAQDFQNYKAGNCGVVTKYGYRNPPAAPKKTKPTSSSSVAPKGKNRHRFVLDKCRGLKNGGGLGHYGASRGGGTRTHSGTDYYAPIGTPLKSPCAGKITQSAGPTGGKVDPGARVQINCNNGDVFRLLHMHTSPRRLRSGTRVGPGTVVGGVGKSGNARKQAPHVHLHAVVKGRRVDPQSLWACGGKSGY